MPRLLPLLLLALPSLGHATAQSPGGGAREVRIEHHGAASELRLGAGDVFHTTTAAVSGLRVVEVAGSTALVVTWQERSGLAAPQGFAATSLDGISIVHVHESSGTLQLAHGSFDPLAGVPEVDPLLRAGAESELRLVQFVAQPIEPFLRGVEALGARLLAYVPDNAYVVDLHGVPAASVAGLPYVRWVGAYHPAYKLDAAVRLGLRFGESLRPQRAYNVLVFEKGPDAKEITLDRAIALGAGVQNPDAGARLLELVLTPEQLQELVRLDVVQFADLWGAPEQDMDLAIQFGGGSFFHDTLGFSGQGVRGEVMDGGVRMTHVAFAPGPQVHGPFPAEESHGTSTYGIVFANGNSCPKGMLPNAAGIFTSYIGLANRYNETAELVNPALPWQGVFQSNSWGSPLTTQYTTITVEMDQILFDLDVLICQSQSNSGSQNSRPQAWAKNILSVGGVKHQNTLPTNDDSWTFGGSIGPAVDGRIKPDLAHFYDFVATTTSGFDTACTTGFNGTSSATPIVAGHSGLFYQIWHSGLLGNTPGASVFASRPHMTLAKAMLLNTADQWTFSGASADLTRVHQGWGRPNVKNIYDRRNAMYWVNETDVLTAFSNKLYTLEVAPGEPALRATLVFADPPGNPAVQTQHRVNDLTLKLISPSNVVYWGNQGLLANMWSTPGGSGDHVDTVECVFVQNPEAGSWKAFVIADEVNQDSHVETPALDADYSLVVTGAVHNDVQPGVPYCSGDATLATLCPCFNSGIANHGCANSVEPQGAKLAGSGIVATDTVTLTASQVPPNALTIFMKGDTTDPSGIVFGDGVRCVDGNLIRFGLQNASAGGVAAFPGALPGTVSAAGGTPVGSGITAYYQAYYRNSDGAFCPPATFNITNGYRLTW
jgi:serine protease AprX